jgi:hypothetical protein
VSSNDQVASIFYGAHVVPGSYDSAYNHYNLLSTILAAFNLSGPNNAATASAIQVFQISTSSPILTVVTETPSSGDLNAGNTVTIALGTSEAVTVSGSPTLTLNDGGTATYDAGTSTSTSLVFDYTGASTDTNVASLAVTSVDVPAGASIVDAAGNNLDPSLSGLTQTGPQISTSSPILTVVTETPSSGDDGVQWSDFDGTLQLDDSASFAGTVAGMADQDTFDLRDISFGSHPQLSYAGDNSGGTLRITDATHSASIALLGNYLASTFATSSEGHGGTNVVDQPAASGNQSTTLSQSHA